MASARNLAVNTATSHENRIHSDGIASLYGFQSGLVPGVNIYGYMAEPVLRHFGGQWLECGWMRFRLTAPFYDGETVVVETDGQSVSAKDTRGQLRASGTVGLTVGIDCAADSANLAPQRALPASRPPVSDAELSAGMVLGSLDTCFASEPRPVELLSLANDILIRNFVMPAWLHVASEVRNHRRISANEPVQIRGTIADLFVRKGHNFLTAGVTILNRRGQRAQTVRHTAIWQRRRFGHRAANSLGD